MSQDTSLIGTYRMHARVDAYHNLREPDGHPDEIVERDLYYEADGTEVTDPARQAAIRARQEEQRNGEG